MIRFLALFGLIHEPNNRSSHKTLTPHGGGIGIVISTIFFTLWLIWQDTGSHTAYWAAIGLSLIVAIKGLVDDVIHLPALLRIIIQAGVSSILILTLYTLPIKGLEPIDVTSHNPQAMQYFPFVL